MPVPGKMGRIPNTVAVCIDKTENQACSGRLYHFYSKEAESFSDIAELINIVTALLKATRFPQATIQTRSFKKTHTDIYELDIDSENKVMPIEGLAEMRGQRATILFCITSRQNASWQGDYYIPVSEEKGSFESDIELLNIIQNALK